MAKTFGYGSVLSVATTTGGDLEIAQIRSLSGPGVSFNDVDTTCMDSTSNYRTFVAGLGDPGELTCGLVYDSTSLSHARMCYYMGQRSSKTWKVTNGSTAGDQDTFTAYIKGMSREIPMDDVITADVTFKVSGLPGYTT